MRAKIVLKDGVVVEVEGTVEEIADLTAALRRSQQVANAEDTPTGALAVSPSLTVDERVSGPMDAAEAPGFWGEEGGYDWTSSDLEEPDELTDFDLRGHPDESDPQDMPEVIDEPIESGAPEHSVGDPTGSMGPPLDLVVREVADQFRLLADPTRLQILTLLTDRGHNVGELCEAMGGQSQPAVSHHLALLRVSGLVVPSREGKFNYYDLTEQGRTLTGVVGRFGPPDGARASELFRKASDPTRLQVLAVLSQADRNVSELCSDLGGQSQSAVSHHLALLRHGGLIEARRAGKFVYYSLCDEGRELTRLIVPMLAAKAGAVVGPEADACEAEPIDDSAVADGAPEEPANSRGDADLDGQPNYTGAPPAHILCRRVLLMVRELHRRGFERLRIAPGLSPSGLHWLCTITPCDDVRGDHGALALGECCLAARYASGQGARFFDWADAESDLPAMLADKFLDRFPGLSDLSSGSDPD
jgi:DNA-binding transcriptional ArsR family regulator